jgi:hypothetical protein
MLLGLAPVARVEINRAQVNQRSGGREIYFGRLAIRFDYVFHRRTSLLKFQPFLEPVFCLDTRLMLASAGILSRGLAWKGQQLADLSLVEVQQ